MLPANCQQLNTLDTFTFKIPREKHPNQRCLRIRDHLKMQALLWHPSILSIFGSFWCFKSHKRVETLLEVMPFARTWEGMTGNPQGNYSRAMLVFSFRSPGAQTTAQLTHPDEYTRAQHSSDSTIKQSGELHYQVFRSNYKYTSSTSLVFAPNKQNATSRRCHYST